MHSPLSSFPSLLLFSLTLTTLLFGTTSAQQTDTNSTSNDNSSQTDYQVRCLRFPPTIAGNRTFEPDAITNLSTALTDNTFDPPLPADGIRLPPGGSSRVGWAGNGGYQVCLQNFYFFKTVTVPLADVAAAVAEIADSCCEAGRRARVGLAGTGTGGRQGKCQDSKAIIRAPSGENIKVVGQDYGDNCCGMWGC